MLVNLAQRASAGIDPFLRFLLIQEIFLEFPRGMRGAKLLQPLLFRALVGECLIAAPGLGKFLTNEPRERPEIGVAAGECLEFVQARLAVFEQSERGFVGNGARFEFVAETPHRPPPRPLCLPPT